MPSYDEWNEALATHFTAGQPDDTRIFMSVDTHLIDAVGRSLGVEANAVDDFKRAVRDEVVFGDSLDVARLCRSPRYGTPNGVAFMAACVLAATQMQNLEERGIRETNFFSHLRNVLGLPDVKGRPDGLTPSDDERLWESWNRYLTLLGLHSTARRGLGGREFVELPISQTLLREADKDRLVDLFSKLHLGADLDPASLLNRLATEPLHSRVVEALADERREATVEAIHDLYEDWRVQRDHHGPDRTGLIYAGLYYTIDIFGNAEWLIYPREPRHLHRTLGSATRDGERFPLSQHRPGHLNPLTIATVNDLDQGTRFEIEGGGAIVLPKRDYWVLVSDPQDREDNVFASWGAPTLGRPFMVLTRKEKLSAFHRLRDDGILQIGSSAQAFGDDRWWVLERCQVLSERATRDIKSLYGITELSPRSRLAISVTGGIPAPGRGGWMEDHGPSAAVVAFDREADVKVIRPEEGHTVLDARVSTGERISVDLNEPGLYRIEVRTPDKEVVRDIAIVAWAELRATQHLAPPDRDLNGTLLCGARLQPSVKGGQA